MGTGAAREERFAVSDFTDDTAPAAAAAWDGAGEDGGVEISDFSSGAGAEAAGSGAGVGAVAAAGFAVSGFSNDAKSEAAAAREGAGEDLRFEI